MTYRTSQWRLRPYLPVIAVALAAAIIRVAYLVATGGTNPQILDSMGDQYIYLDLAQSIAGGRGMTTSRDVWVATAGQPTSIMPPLYPWLLSGLIVSGVDPVVATRVLQVVLSTALVFIAFELGSRLAGRSAGLWSATITACYPAFVQYCRAIMPETLFIVLVSLLVLLSMELRTRPHHFGLAVAWGIVGGLAMLARTEALFLALALCATLSVTVPVRTVHRFRLGAVLMGLVLLCQTPFILHNYQAHGHLSAFPNKRWSLWDQTWWAAAREQQGWRGIAVPERHMLAGWNEMTEFQRDAALGEKAIEFVLANPGTTGVQRIKNALWAYPLLPRELVETGAHYDERYPSTSVDDVVHYERPAELIRLWSFRLVFAMAACAAVIIARTGITSAMVPVLVGILWNVAHVTAFVGRERQRMQTDLLLIVMAATLIAYAVRRARNRREPASGSLPCSPAA
jgi:hypothetical protein